MGNSSPTQATLIDGEKYMKERVEFKINIYETRGNTQKVLYYIVSSLAIILAASVPVAVNIFEQTLIPTVLSLVVTILVGLEKLFLFREHWKNYDLAEQSLRREKYLFQARTGIYAGRKKGKDKSDFKSLNDEDALRLFVQRFEDRIQEEREETIETRTQPLEATGP